MYQLLTCLLTLGSTALRETLLPRLLNYRLLSPYYHLRLWNFLFKCSNHLSLGLPSLLLPYDVILTISLSLFRGPCLMYVLPIRNLSFNALYIVQKKHKLFYSLVRSLF